MYVHHGHLDVSWSSVMGKASALILETLTHTLWLILRIMVLFFVACYIFKYLNLSLGDPIELSNFVREAVEEDPNRLSVASKARNDR